MAYTQNPGRGKSDSYASMLSKGLINEPTEKGPQIGDQISYKGKNVEVIPGGGSNTVKIKFPSTGQITSVSTKDYNTAKQQYLTSLSASGPSAGNRTDAEQNKKRTTIDKVKDMKKNAPEYTTERQKEMIAHQANEMQKIFDAQND